uniref:ATPase associated with various cellular activities, AAA_5 n=1 Tax=uncultured bacterium A1Q1_fos_2286 TaxID=1256566 RepID=L7VTZ6_9BACT|nr:ATPase associated with various cellular activities, AAA_5 [uncultured bacterium A1Q1_fos_2286]
MTTYDGELLGRLTTAVVGRRRELEAIVASLGAGRHLLLEGPPGTGKSTVLRAVAEGSGTGFEFVEGNAELTPARLLGAFDPSAVIEGGYRPEAFVDGPLLAALRDGSLLYVEELNRVPEDTLNVLITVMSEGEVHVPRLGHVEAAPGFRLVAAMNPFDSIGTARIAAAVYDRCCRLSMGYQDSRDELAIVERRTGAAAGRFGETATLSAVQMVRDSRSHHAVRTGSSVRGAIDLVLVADRLAELRGLKPWDPGVTLDAALLALSGRLRLREGNAASAEEIVEELWRRRFAPVGGADEPDASQADAAGLADDRAAQLGASADDEPSPGKA